MFSSSANKHLLKLGHGCDRRRDSIMDGYVKYGLVQDMQAVYWNGMLSGYAQNGFAEEAVELFNEMMNASVQTDKNFWVVVISSCSSQVILALQNRL
ncbi:hypothetical protein LguiA_008173 [Lonicera macranthoides]